MNEFKLKPVAESCGESDECIGSPSREKESS